MNFDFKGLFIGLILIGLGLGVSIWSITELFFTDSTIRVTEPLKPTLEITIKDNVIDTIYVYDR